MLGLPGEAWNVLCKWAILYYIILHYIILYYFCYFIFLFAAYTNSELAKETDWQVWRQKFVLAVPFIQVTVYKMCSVEFLLLFFPLVIFCLHFLGMQVGCLDFCASSLLHLYHKLAGPVLFLSRVSGSEQEHLVFPHKLSCNLSAPLASADIKLRKQRIPCSLNPPPLMHNPLL